ncbi:Uma2 family endonuclease [Actinomadura sp. 6K520]|nr:Uma2 family endonuclease [Actinomadura sp. 6K520]
MVDEPLSQEEDDALLEGFLALDTPEGFRAELIDGEIVVTPPPGSGHERNIAEIGWQMARQSSTKFHLLSTKGLIVPADEGGRTLRVIPDGTVVPVEPDVFEDDEPWSRPDGVALVIEVTSSRPERDRVAKRRGYARAGIPLYLLVDREEERTTLFSGPDGHDYGHTDQVPFGKSLPLPEPFGFELDTSEFR